MVVISVSIRKYLYFNMFGIFQISFDIYPSVSKGPLGLSSGLFTKGSEVETEEELKAKEAKLLARDAANSFTTKHQGWIYEIADYKAKNLSKELTDLLEDAEPPEETGAVDPNAPIPNIIDPPLILDPNATGTE